MSKYAAKAMLVRKARWTARIVWGMQRQAAAQMLATWRANAFLRSCSAAASGKTIRLSKYPYLGRDEPSLHYGNRHCTGNLRV